MGINLSRITGAFILGTTAFIASQGKLSGQSLNPPANSIEKKQEDTKAKFDVNEFKNLVSELGNRQWRTREKASTRLFQLSKTLPLNERYKFLSFILDEAAKDPELEVMRRLERAQRDIYTSLRQVIASKTEASQKREIPLKLIETIDKKRTAYSWRELTPVVVDIIANEAVSNDTVYDEHTGTDVVQKTWDPELVQPLSKLLLSAVESGKDSKELQKEATKLIIDLTKYPLQEHDTFVALYNIRLKTLAKLPEDKLSEIETGLKEAKKLYLQVDLTNGLEAKLASSATPHLEEILERSIIVFSSNDPKKQTIGMNNINTLKEQFNSPQVKDFVSTKNGSLLFQTRQEFSKDIASTKDLQSQIEIARFISEFARNDIDYHKSYISWLGKQVNNPLLQKLQDKEEAYNILESALIDELCILNTSHNRALVKKETLKPLIQSYTKLAKQSSGEQAFLRKNLQAFVDFEYSSYLYSEEGIPSDLLTLFDTITNNINNLKNKDTRTSLRLEVASALPDSIASTPTRCKDYVTRLSNFYCKDEKNLNTDEFTRLVDSLLNAPDPENTGNKFPPAIMLQFIESNPSYFEKNIEQIISTYKTSKLQAEISTSAKHLQTVHLLFHRLFDEGNKAKTNYGRLTQYFPGTRLVNTAVCGSVNIHSDTSLREQIFRIENWFNKKLEKSIAEVLPSAKIVRSNS